MINIFLQDILLNNLILPQELSDYGLKMEKLDVFVQIKLVEDFIIQVTLNKSLVLTQLLKTKKPFVMQELVLPIKKKILKDKKLSLNKNILMRSSSKTLDLVSIGKEKALIPFWNKSSQEISKKLWSPIKTDYVDLELNSLNGSSKNLMLNSWFSAKILIKKTSLVSSQKIYLQSLQSSLLEITDLEPELTEDKEKNLIQLEKKVPAGKAKLIRVYFNRNQKNLLKQWFGCRRWIYNKCLDAIKNHKIKANKKSLREFVINNKNFKTENTWMIDYEYDLRDEAMNDLLNNIKTNLAKGGKFSMKFKSKKDMNKRNESLSVLSKKWNKKNNFYSPIFRPDKVNSSEKLPDKLNYTSRLKRTPTNKYYFCFPQELELRGENQANKMIFIDPGVKTFLTGYDPEGKIIIWGERDIGFIARLKHYKNKLQGKHVKIKNKGKKNNIRKAIMRINERIFNLVEELHKKLTKWLVENYNYIFLPRLNFHLCKKLNKKSKEKMAAYSHCRFMKRLENKIREYPTTKLIEVKEDFTSKTCSNCGSLHKSLKNKDLYKCEECKIEIGRDINASKNIMLKYLTLRAC